MPKDTKRGKLKLQGIMVQIKKAKPALKKIGVGRMAVFGSYSKGNSHKNSDVDLLVHFDKNKKTFSAYMETKMLMEKRLGRKVDLVTIESVKPLISKEIKKSAVYV